MGKQDKRERRHLKGSDVYLLAMYAGWVLYVLFAAYTYAKTKAWFPIEMTIGTVLLFLYETFALYKLAITKEGDGAYRNKLDRATDAVKGFVSSKIGIAEPLDLDEEIIEESMRKENHD